MNCADPSDSEVCFAFPNTAWGSPIDSTIEVSGATFDTSFVQGGISKVVLDFDASIGGDIDLELTTTLDSLLIDFIGYPAYVPFNADSLTIVTEPDCADSTGSVTVIANQGSQLELLGNVSPNFTPGVGWSEVSEGEYLVVIEDEFCVDTTLIESVTVEDGVPEIEITSIDTLFNCFTIGTDSAGGSLNASVNGIVNTFSGEYTLVTQSHPLAELTQNADTFQYNGIDSSPFSSEVTDTITGCASSIDVVIPIDSLELTLDSVLIDCIISTDSVTLQEGSVEVFFTSPDSNLTFNGEWSPGSFDDSLDFVYSEIDTPDDYTLTLSTDDAVGDCFIATENTVEEIQCSIDGDINQDGAVNTADLTLFLGELGNTCSCPQDINGDGIVNVADQNILLSSFGLDWTDLCAGNCP